MNRGYAIPKQARSWARFGMLGLLIALATLPLLAQQDHRTPTSTEVVIIDGQSYSIKYHLEIPESQGMIAVKNNEYYFETDLPLAELTPKLVFEFPNGITILFSKDWNHSDNIYKGPSCKKIALSSKILSLQPSAMVGKVMLNARATPTPPISAPRANCASEATKFQITYHFTGDKAPSQPPPPTNDSVIEQAKPDVPTIVPQDESSDPTVIPEDEGSATTSIATEQASTTETTTETGLKPATGNRTAPEDNSPARKSEEDEAYDDMIKANSLAAFEVFLEQYQNSKYSEEVRKKIAERKPISIAGIRKVSRGYKVDLENVIAPLISNISDTLVNAYVVEANHNSYTATVIVEVPMGFERNVNFKIFDPKKDTIRYTTIYLGDHLVPTILRNPNSSTIARIEFKGGEPPYQVLFKQRGRHIKKESGILDSIWEPDPAFFSKMEGLYSIEISDSRQSTPLANPEWQMRIERKNPYLPYYLGGVAILMSLVVWGYPLFKAMRKRNSQDRFANERLQKWKQRPQQMQAEQAKLLVDQHVEVEEGGNAFEEVAAAVTKQASVAGIRIKKVTKANDKTKVQHNWQELEEILQTTFTFSFSMQQFWEDTAVQDIYFTREALEQLDQFLHEENLRPLQEQDGQVPEIGGLLMGRPFQAENSEAYRVLAETFVPISPEYHDKYQLEFSSQSLAQDLGDAQDKFPQLSLVGWFHTHPGHGLFLSKPDLRIHDTFFKKPYQFAMEIDSLTERLDTGFFTRMQNGKVNNRRNVPTSKSWFSWIDAENLAR